MRNQVLENYLRTNRKKSGLSQRELGLLVGYKDLGQVSRHERSHTAPSLATALAYEVIFHAPVSELFPGIHANVTGVTERRLAAFEAGLQRRSAKARGANAIAQKLIWLEERNGL